MKRAVWFLVTALSVACPLGAAADLIVPVSQTRTVATAADSNPGSPTSSSHSAPGFAAFDAQANAYSWNPNQDPSGSTHCCGVVSTLRHRSIIEPDRLWVDGTGTAYREWPIGVGTGSGSLVYDVTFDLTALSSYVVVGFLTGGCCGTPLSFSATLWDASDDAIFSIGGFQSRSGTLAPGQYRFEVLLDRNGLGDSVPEGSYHGWADLNFTEVIPEPASASLVGLGLALLASRRRHRQRVA